MLKLAFAKRRYKRFLRDRPRAARAYRRPALIGKERQFEASWQ